MVMDDDDDDDDTSHSPAFNAPTEDLQVTIHSLDLPVPCQLPDQASASSHLHIFTY